MNAEVEYSFLKLMQGRVDRIFLPDVAVQVLAASHQTTDEGDEADRLEENEEEHEDPWSFLTVKDLLQQLPILPFEEIRMDRATIFREKATGPLRKVTVSGLMTSRQGELSGRLSFQGSSTVSYGLTLAGSSASSWSATLVSHRFQTVPIISYESSAHSIGSHIQIKGKLEVNVRELAPFIALLVPIGPDLEKVTGQITIQWAGTAAPDASLASLWRDSRTRVEGDVRVYLTLPALMGIAKDIAMTYQGTFAGNATEIVWTLTQGSPLAATISNQTVLLPPAFKNAVPRGDQSLRLEHVQPLEGTFYWSESPMRMVVTGPLRLTYGQAPGTLLVELEASYAEWVGWDLSMVEGAYHITGALPQGIAEGMAPYETSVDVQGHLKVKQAKVQGTMLAPSFIRVRGIDHAMAAISNATFQLQDSVAFQCETVIVRCHGGPAVVGVRLPSFRVMGREVFVGQADLTLQRAEWAGSLWQVQGKVVLQAVSPIWAPWRVPATDWKVSFVASQGGIKADLHVGAPFYENFVTAQIDQPLPAGEGMLHATIGPIDFDGADHRLSRLMTRVSWPVELIEGRLTSTVDALWVGGWGVQSQQFRVMSATATVAAEKLSGRYEGYVFKNANTTVTMRANGLGSVFTVEPAHVTVGVVGSGVEVTNLSLKIGGKWNIFEGEPLIELSDVRCHAFGGTITSDGWAWD
ncbi:MAG: hypothetical protein NZM29_02980, partial [Nitrospira sp.]|nr:hypothetical protein [Nitrospira sp.]